MTWGLLWFLFSPFVALGVAFLVHLAISRWRHSCRRGYHVWTDRKRTPPVYRECMWIATLSCRCSRCGYEHSEERWAFMHRAGALNWICGGDVENTDDQRHFRSRQFEPPDVLVGGDPVNEGVSLGKLVGE